MTSANAAEPVSFDSPPTRQIVSGPVPRSLLPAIAALVILSTRFGTSLNFVAVYFDYIARSENCALFTSPSACVGEPTSHCAWYSVGNVSACGFAVASGMASNASTTSTTAAPPSSSGSYGFSVSDLTILGTVGPVAFVVGCLVTLKLVPLNSRYCLVASAVSGMLAAMLYSIGQAYFSVGVVAAGRFLDGLSGGIAIGDIGAYVLFVLGQTAGVSIDSANTIMDLCQTCISGGLVLNLLYGIAVLPTNYAVPTNYFTRLECYFLLTWLTSLAMAAAAAWLPQYRVVAMDESTHDEQHAQQAGGQRQRQQSTEATVDDGGAPAANPVVSSPLRRSITDPKTPAVAEMSIAGMVLRCVLLGSCMQLSGIPVVILYGPSVLKKAVPGLDPLLANLVIWILGTLVAATLPVLQKRVATVRLLLLGVALCSVGDLIAGVCLVAAPNTTTGGVGALVGSAVLVIGFSLVAATLTPASIECFPSHVVRYSAPLAQMCGNTTMTVVSALFPVVLSSVTARFVATGADANRAADVAQGSIFLFFAIASAINVMVGSAALSQLHELLS